MKTRGKKIKSGFTLIEIMVSISIFSIVMVIVIGALLMLNDANKKAQALRAVVDNLNFAIEDMTRNIKTGKEYACGVVVDQNGRIDPSRSAICSDTKPQNGIIIKGRVISSTRRECIMYFFEKPDLTVTPVKLGSIKYAISRKGLISGTNSCSGVSVWNSITAANLVSPEVIINDASFSIINTDPVASYKQQPIVILNINGEIDIDKYKFKTPFSIQTTVSQRSSIDTN